MRKKILVLSVLLTLFIGGTTLATEKTENKVLLTNNSNITYGTNDLSDISSANPLNFDSPQANSNGVLERMPTTEINTKYGVMQITQEAKGYQCKNLSNANAPILNVATVNNIYTVGGQVDLEALITPEIVNSSGQQIQGQIIFPEVNTKTPNYGAKYVEAVGENGAITVAPFVYNTVQFKSSVTLSSYNDVKNLNINDVLEGGGSSDLRFYIGNYTQGSDTVVVGLNRGMASVQQEIGINIKSSTAVTPTPNQNNTNTGNINISKNSAKVPFLISLLINKFTYIITGAILILIVAYFCFIGEKRK
ncbi:MAG: hypothetical protein ACRDD2_07895 [Sarcina sp.]